MIQTRIRLGELDIAVTFKAVKHVHLTVHPPLGNVSLVAPSGTRMEVARAYAISKLRWIRQQQEQLRRQARESPRRYLLDVVEHDAAPSVTQSHRHIILRVRPGTDAAQRESIYRGWQRSLLHQVIPAMIERWEQRLGVKVSGYFLQRMKTKWGSCNHKHAHIRLNTELVKKPKDLLEYVVVHEMIHLLEPTHNKRFIALLDQHYPAWREARMELNELPLGKVD